MPSDTNISLPNRIYVIRHILYTQNTMSLLKLRQTNKLPNKQIAHYSVCKKINKNLFISSKLGLFSFINRFFSGYSTEHFQRVSMKCSSEAFFKLRDSFFKFLFPSCQKLDEKISRHVIVSDSKAEK